MSRRRPGWRAAVRTYNHLTRELQTAAHKERDTNAAELLREAVYELRDLHAYHYGQCEGCPADDLIKRSLALLDGRGLKPFPVGCQWAK